jgi:hypothetical protein
MRSTSLGDHYLLAILITAESQTTLSSSNGGRLPQVTYLAARLEPEADIRSDGYIDRPLLKMSL